MRLRFETEVGSTFELTCERFDHNLFKFLSPPFPRVIIKRYDGNSIGDLIEIHLWFFLFTWEWVSVITENESTSSNWFFVDVGKKLPPFLKNWSHRHEIMKTKNQSVIIDDITFEAARFWPDFLVKFLLTAQFSKRPELYKKYFSMK